jgi:hypothetical protein
MYQRAGISYGKGPDDAQRRPLFEHIHDCRRARVDVSAAKAQAQTSINAGWRRQF